MIHQVILLVVCLKASVWFSHALPVSTSRYLNFALDFEQTTMLSKPPTTTIDYDLADFDEFGTDPGIYDVAGSPDAMNVADDTDHGFVNKIDFDTGQSLFESGITVTPSVSKSSMKNGGISDEIPENTLTLFEGGPSDEGINPYINHQQVANINTPNTKYNINSHNQNNENEDDIYNGNANQMKQSSQDLLSKGNTKLVPELSYNDKTVNNNSQKSKTQNRSGTDNDQSGSQALTRTNEDENIYEEQSDILNNSANNIENTYDVTVNNDVELAYSSGSVRQSSEGQPSKSNNNVDTGHEELVSKNDNDEGMQTASASNTRTSDLLRSSESGLQTSGRNELASFENMSSAALNKDNEHSTLNGYRAQTPLYNDGPESTLDKDGHETNLHKNTLNSAYNENKMQPDERRHQTFSNGSAQKSTPTDNGSLSTVGKIESLFTSDEDRSQPNSDEKSSQSISDENGQKSISDEHESQSTSKEIGSQSTSDEHESLSTSDENGSQSTSDKNWLQSTSDENHLMTITDENGLDSTLDLNGEKTNLDQNGLQLTSDENSSQSTSDENGSQSTSDENSSQSSSDENGSQSTSDENGLQSTSDENEPQKTSDENESLSTSDENGSRSSSDENRSHSTSDEKGAKSTSDENWSQSTSDENGPQKTSDENGSYSNSDENGSTSDENGSQSTSDKNGSQSTSDENGMPSSEYQTDTVDNDNNNDSDYVIDNTVSTQESNKRDDNAANVDDRGQQSSQPSHDLTLCFSKDDYDNKYCSLLHSLYSICKLQFNEECISSSTETANSMHAVSSRYKSSSLPDTSASSESFEDMNANSLGSIPSEEHRGISSETSSMSVEAIENLSASFEKSRSIYEIISIIRDACGSICAAAENIPRGDKLENVRDADSSESSDGEDDFNETDKEVIIESDEILDEQNTILSDGSTEANIENVSMSSDNENNGSGLSSRDYSIETTSVEQFHGDSLASTAVVDSIHSADSSGDVSFDYTSYASENNSDQSN